MKNNNKKSQNISIYFLNKIDDSVKVIYDNNKEVKCHINNQRILDCIIDNILFPYDKSKPEDYMNYELKIKDLCGNELYKFNISVNNIVEDDDDDDGIGVGLIIVIILGSILIIAGIVFLIFRVKKKNQKTDIEEIPDKKLLSDM